ncbi:hypothetical protein H072_9341 [Dactylellina haptotyla CBS 200.50]|uniref:Peptidase A1 domain-containing protein n=1 Tax=Dactylellina haptotyla (strain CBS 200.50) TaxID=1284197 RepID=S8A2T6_DACHA|nr:hypothetical protein H072_9341 [Dactylellina haptotyla CBS 200.50]
MRLIAVICLATCIPSIKAFVPWRVNTTNLDPSTFYAVETPSRTAIRRHELRIYKAEAKFKSRASNKVTINRRKLLYSLPFARRDSDKTSGPISLSSDPDDISYWVDVEFGSSKKSFRMVIDTGSADTWIPSSNCNSKSCLAHRTFGSADSSTLDLTGNESFSIKYASGNVEGTIVKDTLALGSIILRNVGFGLATTVSDDFTTFPVDGILGLGFPSASAQKIPTFLDNLVSQNIISRRLFGVYLHRTSDGEKRGSVIFGMVDDARIDGGTRALNYHDLNKTSGLWSIHMDDVVMDSESANFGGRNVIIDTGTALILIPPADALKLHQYIPETKSNGETFYIPCDTKTRLEFQFGNIKYEISSKDYIGNKVDAEGKFCLSLIVGRSVLRDGAWLIGDVFLRNVYSVFDMDNLRIGFGIPAVNPDSAGTSTTSPLVAPPSTLTSAPSNDAIPTSSTVSSESSSSSWFSAFSTLIFSHPEFDISSSSSIYTHTSSLVTLPSEPTQTSIFGEINTSNTAFTNIPEAVNTTSASTPTTSSSAASLRCHTVQFDQFWVAFFPLVISLFSA